MAWVATFYPNWFPFEAEYCTHRDAKAWEGQWVASCRAPLQRATRCLRRGYSAELPAPGIKTHTYPPSYTHNTYSICPTNKHTSCTYTCSYLPISSFSSYMNPPHTHCNATDILTEPWGATPSLSQRHRNFNHGQMPWLSLWNISLVLSCRYSTNGADFWLFFWNQGLPNPSVWWVYRSVMVYWSNERPETVKLGGYHKKITIRHFFWDTLYNSVSHWFLGCDHRHRYQKSINFIL